MYRWLARSADGGVIVRCGSASMCWAARLKSTAPLPSTSMGPPMALERLHIQRLGQFQTGEYFR
jgi:hypothetical protein